MHRPPRLAVPLVLLLAAAASADVRLPRIFADHMVLQQGLPIAVWGWAEPGEQVTVTLAGASASAKAGGDGSWRVDLPAMKADGEARELVVKGRNTLTLTNVLLGEIWLCAGQSNMNRSVEVKESHPQIRLFWIEGSTMPMKDDLGERVAGWAESRPEAIAATRPAMVRGREVTRKTFAEVGYVFGRKVHEELEVPVGLIKAAFGGSQVRSWTPKPDLTKEYPYGQEVKKGYVGHTPGLLYQSMVHGMVPFTLRGVLWYQGENDGRNREYHEDLTLWIESWRKLWGRGDLPFYMVQIAPTSYAGGKMQYLWESQVWAIENIPHTGLAVTNDMMSDTNRDGSTKLRQDKVTGFPILGGSNPHPDGKHIAGERLANIALVETYGRAERVLYGPMYASHEIQGAKVVVRLEHVGGGLATRDGKAPNWFELSDGTRQGRSLVYRPAQARIVAKGTVEVTCPEVKQPKFVRFAWHCLARHNLMNREGLPAVSFRTDREGR